MRFDLICISKKERLVGDQIHADVELEGKTPPPEGEKGLYLPILLKLELTGAAAAGFVVGQVFEVQLGGGRPLVVAPAPQS